MTSEYGRAASHEGVSIYSKYVPWSKWNVRAELSLYLPSDFSIVQKGAQDMHAAHSPVTKAIQR